MDELRAEAAEADFGDQVKRTMRECRSRTGKTPAKWALELQPKVEYGTVKSLTVQSYEAGRNVPGADYYLAALATAGLPIHHLIELWLDPATSSLVRQFVLMVIAH